MNMQTRTLLLAGLLAAAGCGEHRVATAPPASTPAATVATAPTRATANTTAAARAAPAPAHPVPESAQAIRFYTPSDQQQSPVPTSIQGSQPVQAAQPVHALGQPGGQANNLPAQNAYNTPPQGYVASGLNSDPNNPSGAPGYSSWH